VIGGPRPQERQRVVALVAAKGDDGCRRGIGLERPDPLILGQPRAKGSLDAGPKILALDYGAAILTAVGCSPTLPE
jgi:hypothetical protein